MGISMGYPILDTEEYGGLVNLHKLWSFSPLAWGHNLAPLKKWRWTYPSMAPGCWALKQPTAAVETLSCDYTFLLPRKRVHCVVQWLKLCTCSTSYVLQGGKTPQLATELTIVNHFRWPFQIVKDSRTHLHHWWNPTAHFFWKDAQPLVIKGGREIPKKNLRWEKHQTKWLWK